MIMDQNLVFFETEDAFGAAGTVNLGDVVDLGTATQRRPGESGNMALVIELTTAIAGGNSISLQLVSDSVTAPATDGNQTVHAISAPLSSSDAVGTKLILPLPGGANYERYMGVQVVRVGTSTAGAFSAFLVMDAQNWTPMADAEGRIYGA